MAAHADDSGGSRRRQEPTARTNPQNGDARRSRFGEEMSRAQRRLILVPSLRSLGTMWRAPSRVAPAGRGLAPSTGWRPPSRSSTPARLRLAGSTPPRWRRSRIRRWSTVARTFAENVRRPRERRSGYAGRRRHKRRPDLHQCPPRRSTSTAAGTTRRREESEGSENSRQSEGRSRQRFPESRRGCRAAPHRRVQRRGLRACDAQAPTSVRSLRIP